MSTVPVANILSNALTELGDPNGTIYRRAVMLGFYNRIQSRVAIAMKCLERDSDFDIVANEQRYAYPDDCVVINGIRYSETPGDSNTFFWLKEQFRDEYRDETNRLYPTGRVWGYYARMGFFELIAKPTVAIVGGGILTYAYKPTKVTTETGAVMELPDFHENFVQEGVMILARMAGRERAAAQADLKNWEAELDEMGDRMSDRSDDRRPALRPVSERGRWYGET